MLQLSRWTIIVTLLVSFLSVIYAFPNMLDQKTRDHLESSLPAWLPSRAVTLGLDLQGGSHLLLEVKTDVAIEDRVNTLVDQIRSDLRSKNIGYENLNQQGMKASVNITKPEQLDEARKIIATIDPGIVQEMDGAKLNISLSEAAIKDKKRQVVEQSIEIVRRRVDESGTREPSIMRQGDDRIVVQLPGVNDPERIKNLLGKTAKLTFRFVNDDVSAVDIAAKRAPAGTEILPSADEKSGRMEVVSRRVMLTGEMLTDAQATFQEGLPVVSFVFDGVGAKKFAEATSNNVGKRFAIVLDNQVISAPVIREPILGGRGIISGNFTVEAAKDLSLLLRAGALPAPLTVLEERTVGAGLGSDSIQFGMIAALVGVILVVGLMLISYGLFGLFAVISLAFNIAMIFAGMTLLGATLTLPGIAGIVLVIGTTVDANVLIYERMRDEYKNGRTLMGALDAGYSRAMSAIIDANVTSLLGAVLMFWFGSGPIKGFAVTLSFGIVTSLFTAIMLNRLMVITWVKMMKPKALPI
ncbi:MAG: protein translocase subunit SecD [Alphaproteobacteria bacterium]|nr:protein translocase subunit SecD [Alphaproteobacteria bacterium]